MYEHHSQDLLSTARFAHRMLGHLLLALIFVTPALLLGACGYRYLEGWSWLDAELNAAMILSGMGPVNEVHSVAGKIFASAYAVFSGIFFLVIASVVIAPLAHRLLHQLHLENKSR